MEAAPRRRQAIRPTAGQTANSDPFEETGAPQDFERRPTAVTRPWAAAKARPEPRCREHVAQGSAKSKAVEQRPNREAERPPTHESGSDTAGGSPTSRVTPSQNEPLPGGGSGSHSRMTSSCSRRGRRPPGSHGRYPNSSRHHLKSQPTKNTVTQYVSTGKGRLKVPL